MSGSLEKLALAARLAFQNPSELIDRVISVWEALRERGDFPYAGTEWHAFLERLTIAVGGDVATALDDPALADLEREIVARIEAMDRTPFVAVHSADLLVARICYALCRSMKPACIVETGVAYGVTSTFFLAALEANGRGVLHSIDLPPLAAKADQHVGFLIPRELRGRWRLHRGATRRVLPKLLPLIGPIDIFLHDSLHTYPSLSRELRQVLPRMSNHAAVIVDDIESNSAYSEWATLAAPPFSAVVRQSHKRALFGVAIF